MVYTAEIYLVSSHETQISFDSFFSFSLLSIHGSGSFDGLINPETSQLIQGSWELLRIPGGIRLGRGFELSSSSFFSLFSFSEWWWHLHRLVESSVKFVPLSLEKYQLSTLDGIARHETHQEKRTMKISSFPFIIRREKRAASLIHSSDRDQESNTELIPSVKGARVKSSIGILLLDLRSNFA